MPYKDPERKRQWEREHRQERNAKRRNQQYAMPTPQPDAGSDQQPRSTGRLVKGLAGCALAVALAVLVGFGLDASISDIS